MNLKKTLFVCLSLLMLAFVPKQVQAACISGPIECHDFDLKNLHITPMPVYDNRTDIVAVLAEAEEVWNNIFSLAQLVKYIEKMQKLSLNPFSLAQAIDGVDVPAIESAVKGTQTIVDGYRGSVPGIKSAVVDFKNEKTTQAAISKAAVVANPTNTAEELAANERRRAFIQQAIIDLHADILVAKAKLSELKEADKEAQESSSTGDTIGNSNIVIQMKSFENQVQALEENLAAMRIVLEGIKGLRSADTLKEDVTLGDKND